MRGATIERVRLGRPDLRAPFPPGFEARLRGQTVADVARRGKYLLALLSSGDTLVMHLGMSGSFRVMGGGATKTPGMFHYQRSDYGAHDHVVFRMSSGATIAFNDPRRFGSFMLTTTPETHPLLKELGPEPLGADFDADYLAATCRKRSVAIKQHLMNAKVVVGIGNIYANEALFRAGIHPARAAGRIARARFEPLVVAARDVLKDAIEEGGTTLRNFVGGDGKPGYFRTSLRVYERDGLPCIACGAAIERRVQGQRATYYCPRCQR